MVRGPKWSEVQISALVEGVAEHQVKLFGAFSDSLTKVVKDGLWIQIQADINARAKDGTEVKTLTQDYLLLLHQEVEDQFGDFYVSQKKWHTLRVTFNIPWTKQKAVQKEKARQQTGGARDGVAVTVPTFSSVEEKCLQTIPHVSIHGVADAFDSLAAQKEYDGPCQVVKILHISEEDMEEGDVLISDSDLSTQDPGHNSLSDVLPSLSQVMRDLEGRSSSPRSPSPPPTKDASPRMPELSALRKMAAFKPPRMLTNTVVSETSRSQSILGPAAPPTRPEPSTARSSTPSSTTLSRSTTATGRPLNVVAAAVPQRNQPRDRATKRKIPTVVEERVKRCAYYDTMVAYYRSKAELVELKKEELRLKIDKLNED